jgi:hypothetical protein
MITGAAEKLGGTVGDEIFALWHIYEVFSKKKIKGFEKYVGAFSSGGRMYYDFETFIGVFSSEEKCHVVIAELLARGYFVNKPDNFVISREPIYVPGCQLGWSDGFVGLGESDE